LRRDWQVERGLPRGPSRRAPIVKLRFHLAGFRGRNGRNNHHRPTSESDPMAGYKNTLARTASRLKHQFAMIGSNRNSRPGSATVASRLSLNAPSEMVMRVASFFPFQTTYYLNGSQFHRTGTDLCADRLPQERQCVPGTGRDRRAAGRRRSAEPGHHPKTARLLDAGAGAEVLVRGAQSDYPVSLLAITQIEYCRNFIFRSPCPTSSCSVRARNPHRRGLRGPREGPATSA
jgi:hypothetical protein